MLPETDAGEIVRYIEMIAPYGEVTKFILDHGTLMTEFSPKHADFPRGEMGDCYPNAGRIANGKTLRYVEGYATPSTVPIPMMHAWLIDEQGRVIDPTWKDGNAYYGVVIPYATMWELLGRLQYWGIFDNLWIDQEAISILQEAVL